MRSVLVVVPHELAQQRPKVLLIQDDEMVEALSPKRADQSFGNGVCFWRVNRGGDGVDADAPGSLAEVAAVDRISIAQQLAWLGAPGCCFDELPPNSGSRRVGCVVHVHQLAPPVGNED